MLVGCGSLPFLGGSAKPVLDAAGKPDSQAALALRPTPASAPTSARPAPATIDPAGAVPRVERIAQREPNLPYVVRGDAYEPLAGDVAVNQTGVASWYGEPFHGRRTATGEVYDMNLMTAAHKTMPLPSYALVRNLRNGRQVVVRVNDRGPFKYDRVIDLSRAAAHKLGFTGLAQVEVRRLTNEEIRTGSWKLSPQTLASAASIR